MKEINYLSHRLLQCFVHAHGVNVIETHQCLMIHKDYPDSMQLSLPLYYFDGSRIGCSMPYVA